MNMSTAVQTMEECRRIASDWKNYAPKWFAPTQENFKKLADYIFTPEGGGVVSITSMSRAAEALKSQLEHKAKSPEELENERQVAIRNQIYAEVQEKLAPASLDLADPKTLTRINSWLHKNRENVLTVDSMMDAVSALRFDIAWAREPEGVTKQRRNEHFGFQDSRDNNADRRRNHARETTYGETTYVDDIKNRAQREEALTTETGGRRAIEDVVCITNGRVNHSLTATVKGLLFQFAKKHGGVAVENLIKAMPDDGMAAASYINARL
jgi:hypothetical protein